MVYRIAVCLLGLLALNKTVAGPPKDVTKTEQEPDYDVATVLDSEATVVEVREVPKDNPLSGVNLVIKTDSDATLGVYLGPADFVKSFEITFRKGDRIRITGSKVKFKGDSVVLAREVRKDSSTLFLRDRHGVPYWRLPVKGSA